MSGFCTSCGNSLEQQHQFCGVCGTRRQGLYIPAKSSALSSYGINTPTAKLKLSEAIREEGFSIWNFCDAENLEAWDRALDQLLSKLVTDSDQPLSRVVASHMEAFVEFAEAGTARACRMLSALAKTNGQMTIARSWGWMAFSCALNRWDQLVSAMLVLETAVEELRPRFDQLPMTEQADPLAAEAAHASAAIRNVFEQAVFPPTPELYSWLSEDDQNTREIIGQCGAAIHQLHRNVGRDGARVDGGAPGHAGLNVMGLLAVMDWGPLVERQQAEQHLREFLDIVGRAGVLREQVLQVQCVLPRLRELGWTWAV